MKPPSRRVKSANARSSPACSMEAAARSEKALACSGVAAIAATEQTAAVQLANAAVMHIVDQAWKCIADLLSQERGASGRSGSGLQIQLVIAHSKREPSRATFDQVPKRRPNRHVDSCTRLNL